MGQSIVLSEIKTEVPLENDDPAYQNFLLQRYEERIERLSQENKVSNFCMDAGFINVVEIGQYFMTKDTGEQFFAKACREYTLPRNDGSSQPKGWIQGNTKIGPVLEITTSCLHGKHGIEIRIWSLSEDSTQSWVRISHGSNKCVIDSNNNNTEISDDLPEEQASQLKMKDFAARSKGKAKPHRRELVDSPIMIPMNERKWIDIEPGNSSPSAYEISKKVIHLLRHSQTVQREEDGAVHFWRIKENLQNQFPQFIHWSDDRWKACLAAGGGVKRRYQYCTDISGTIVCFRALQGHSGRSLVDPSLQDNVVIQSGFFQHIYHIGCVLNLHSIINNGLIPGGQNSSKRQTVFFLPIDPRDKGHQDPAKIDFNVPRHAQYMHKAWKKHQDAVFWVDIDLAIRKGLTFYQTRSNAIILQGTLPAYCIPKVVRLKTGEVLYEKSYMSLRPPLKISLRHDWTSGEVPLGSTVDQQPEGKVVRQSRGEVSPHATFSQLTQPIPKPICDRSGQPDNTQDVFVVKGETSRSQEIDEKCFHEELFSSDRSGQPDITPSVIRGQNVSEDIRVEQTHDRSRQPDKHTIERQDAPEVYREITMLNTDNELTREIIEEDIDFKIQGLPHSTVKQLHSASVRELIQKIENHPHRHALERDLQQSQSFNPFSPESKQMIHEVGNIELCELLDTEPKTQCKVCLSYWDIGIVYCTCGHFLRKGTEENKKFVQYTMDLLSIPDYYIKKGRPHGHRYGKKPGDKEYYIAHQLKKKCKKKNFLGIHDRFIRDEKFRKNMFDNGRTEEICRQMDDLADEDHTHHLTPEEIHDYRNNWWIRSNPIGSDTMPIRHRSDFKQALSTLRQQKDKEDAARHNQRWMQSYSSSWWNWQESRWHSSYENHHEDVPSTD